MQFAKKAKYLSVDKYYLCGCKNENFIKLSVEAAERKSFFKKIRGKEEVKSEMSFIDHLEVLRWHLVRSAIAWVLAAIFIFIFIDWIFDHIIFAPARPECVT